MKRSPLKRKTPMKRGQAKKKKARKPNYSSVKKAAWNAFSRYIRLRDSILTTGTVDRCRCITCGKEVLFSEIQAGHAIQGRANNILFDEALTNGQCVRCNIFKGGEYSRYAVIMINKHGKEWFQEKIRISALPSDKPWRTPFLEEVIDKYLDKAEELMKRSDANSEPQGSGKDSK